MSKIQAFLPVRSGSERVPNKNTKPFSEGGESLLQIKLAQLIASDLFDSIILSTDDPTAMSQAEEFENSQIRVKTRPDFLCSSSAKIEDLSKYAGVICETDDVLWTHVTSPFFDAGSYRRAVQMLEVRKPEGFDSMASVTTHKGYFIGSRNEPLFNHQGWRNWPRTQDLEPFAEINSALFIVSRERLLGGARLGVNPLFLGFSRLEGVDIDTEWDWNYARWIQGGGK